MGEFISHTSWMRDVPDDTPVTALSIPGTHNSGSVAGPAGLAQTQNLDISDQLDAGIRFLDIRLAHHQDNLFVHHDVINMNKSCTDVLDVCARFLEEQPHETLLMSVKDECYVDSDPGRLTPSKLLGRLYHGDRTNEELSCSLEDTFKARAREHAPLFYNFDPSPSSNAGQTFDSKTTLGHVRGKIIVLRRFEGGDNVGLDMTYWPENQTFRSAAPPFYDVHDRYQGLSENDKLALVIDHLEEARKGDLADFYITFSSAVDLTARGFAETINPRLNDYLASSSPGRVGIIVTDYFEQPETLVSNVIKLNGDPVRR